MLSVGRHRDHHLKVLGLKPHATEDEVKRAFKSLALQWHPDRHANKELANAKFIEIHDSYRLLSQTPVQSHSVSYHPPPPPTPRGRRPSSFHPAPDKMPSRPASSASNQGHHVNKPRPRTSSVLVPIRERTLSDPGANGDDEHSDRGKNRPKKSSKDHAAPVIGLGATQAGSREPGVVVDESIPGTPISQFILAHPRPPTPRNPGSQPFPTARAPTPHRSYSGASMPTRAPSPSPRAPPVSSSSRPQQHSFTSGKSASSKDEVTTYSPSVAPRGTSRASPRPPPAAPSPFPSSPYPPPSPNTSTGKPGLRNPENADRTHATVYPLSLTLEELCGGTTHTYRITRQLMNDHTVRQLVEIEVLPGWRQGVSVRFEGYGNEGLVDGRVKADDIMFVVVEAAHERFVRFPGSGVVGAAAAMNGPSANNAGAGGEGDLILRQPVKVSKGERVVKVAGVDGTEVVVPVPAARRGQTGESRIVGAGMPVRVKGVVQRRGDLLVHWEIV